MKVTVSEKLQSNGSWSRPWRFPTIQLRGGGLCPGFLTCPVPSSRVTQSKVKCLWTWYCIINLINRFCISYFPYSPDSACLERRRSSYNVGAQDTLTQNMSLRSVKYKLLHSLKVFFPAFLVFNFPHWRQGSPQRGASDDFDEYFIQSNFPARRQEDIEHTPQFHLELPSEGDLREMLKFISFILHIQIYPLNLIITSSLKS